ncbi:MAG: Smr/MutS family protein [Rhodospirillales bacterium]|nr:Smr/MutS family protein [Rhodospirillales bacterium]
MSSDDEEGLWAHVIRTITPLHKDGTPDKITPERTKSPPAPRKKTSVKMPVPTPDSGGGQQTKSPPNPGLDRRSEERLRRGKMAIDVRLDLHGMKQDEAHAALDRFVMASYAQGQRCLLVITGKGRSQGSEGVLRRRVPQWLSMAPFSEIVLRVIPARPQHGGEGALYVLLRRKRG